MMRTENRVWMEILFLYRSDDGENGTQYTVIGSTK